MSPSAVILLHDGFEEMEAVAPIDLLRRADVAVTTASVHDESLTVTGRNGIPILADAAFTDLDCGDFDALILPGGPGIARHVRGNERVIGAVRRHFDAGRVTAAICAAPLVLKDAGILPGPSFTAHTSALEALPEARTDLAVVEDGPLTTSRGAGTATAFALAIVARLTGASTARTVAESICLMPVGFDG